MKKKIAIISSGYFPVPAVRGGAVETLIEKLILSNELHNLFDIYVFSTYDDEAKEKSQNYKNTKIAFIKDVAVVDWLDRLIYFFASIVDKNGKQMSFRYIVHRVAYILRVAEQLRKNNYDYVIVENTTTLFWALKLFDNSNKYKDKIIYHVHNKIGSTFGCRKLLINCKKILCVSEFISNTIAEKIPEVHSDKLCTFYNCIDVKTFHYRKDKRIEIRNKYGIRANDRVFIFVGRLCKEKGIEELLTSFSKIKEENAKLLVVGNYYFGTNLTSKFEERLKSLVEAENRVIFTGFVNNSEIASIYNAADIAVLPSMWDEPAGLTMVEAMASSLSVITTAAGGIPEYVGEGNAILLDKNSETFVDDLRNAMESMMDPLLTKSYSLKSYNRAMMYDYKTYAVNLHCLLNK